MPPRSPTELRPTRPMGIGLCQDCIHLDLLDSRRSLFVFCLLSKTDERFPRYPPLPVFACDGYRVQI